VKLAPGTPVWWYVYKGSFSKASAILPAIIKRLVKPDRAEIEAEGDTKKRVVYTSNLKARETAKP